MDFDEEHGEQPQPQADDMEIDDQDALYLDLRDDWDRQAYAMLKNSVFEHTWHIDPELLTKIGMDSEFNAICHTIGWDTFVPMDEVGSHQPPSNFFALSVSLLRASLFDSLGKIMKLLRKF